MKKRKKLLVIDPTAFPGGSKIATENILSLLDKSVFDITVISADKDSWNSSISHKVTLREFTFLSKKFSGILYFVRHFFIALNILFCRIKYGAFDVVIGASGPGVDLSIYLARTLLNFKIIQLVHGPVATSKTIGKCLLKADSVFYLSSTKTSIENALTRAVGSSDAILQTKFKHLTNGLPASQWPTPCQYKVPRVFWAASLLKWKGLDIFLDAIEHIDVVDRPETSICYIQPRDISLAISNAPKLLNKVYWHKNPHNIDTFRKETNIFVSTSENEPFGLSILEAMASGHCVLIPADGSYWDKILKDNFSCIKYIANDANDLAKKIVNISQDLKRLQLIGQHAFHIAKQYRSDIRYSNIINELKNINHFSSPVVQHKNITDVNNNAK